MIVAITLLGLLAVRTAVEQDTRRQTERVLIAALATDSTTTGEAQVFYLDEHGREIDEATFMRRAYPEGGAAPTTGPGRPRLHDRGPGWVAAVTPVPAADGSGTLGTGVALRQVAETKSYRLLQQILAVAVPLLILLVAVATWLVTGRALRPVERLTDTAARITAESLDERVPEPEARDALRSLAQTLNRMLDRLHQAQQQQRKFVSDASHDLRSPVAASMLQLDLALDDPDGTDWPAAARRVMTEQEVIIGLLDDLLVLTRLDEGDCTAMRPVRLGDIVRDEMERPRATPVRLSDCSDTTVMGVPHLLARAIRNLVDNGVIHAGTPIDVSVVEGADEVSVHVDDTGPGVPEASRERIFERFGRLGGRTTGSGLGLAIASDVARTHRGSLSVTESPGGGARFTLRLPLATGGKGPCAGAGTPQLEG